MASLDPIEIIIAAKNMASSVIAKAGAEVKAFATETNAATKEAAVFGTGTTSTGKSLEGLSGSLAIAKQRLAEAEASGNVTESRMMSLRKSVQDYEAKLASANKVTIDGSAVLKELGSQAGISSQYLGLGPMGLATAAAAAAAAVVVGTSKMAIDFQQKMEMLHTNAGVAQSAIGDLSNKILDMSASVGQGPDALATAFYHIASAGTGIWSTAKQLDILKIAAEGAAIGQANLDDTTYALTSAMSSNIGGVKDAAEMMAVLNATVGAGDMKLQDLNAALSTGILSTAASFGISIQSVGTALATLTDNGEHADEAATRLRMTMALMASPSSMAAKQLSALGLTAEDAKTATDGMNEVFKKSGLTTTKLADDLRQPNGITVAMQDLKTHLENAGLSASETDAMLSKAFGGGRTDAALLTMLQNIDRMNEKFKVINENAGNFASNLAEQQKQPAQQLKEMWAGVQSVMIRVGDTFVAIAEAAGKYLAPVFAVVSEAWNKYLLPAFNWVSGDGGKKTVEFFGVALAGAILAVVTPLVVLGATIMGAIAIMNRINQTVTDVATWLGGTLAKAVMGATVLFQQLPQSIGQALGGLWGAVVGAFNSFSVSATNWARNAVSSIVSEFTNLPSRIGGVIGNAFSGAASTVHDALHNAHIPGFALGTNYAPGGLTMVGENGPELVAMPTGSKVYTAKETAQMASGGNGSGVTINGGLHIHNNMDEQRFLANLGWRLALR